MRPPQWEGRTIPQSDSSPMSPLTIKKTAGTIDKSYVNLLRILLIKWHEKRLAVWNDSNAKNHCRNINLVGVASARRFTALIFPLELENYECLFLFLYYSVLIYISCIRWHVERQKRSRYPCKAINLRKYKALDELVERFVFIESQSVSPYQYGFLPSYVVWHFN